MTGTAIIYTRVSSDEQIHGTSLDTQESICRACAERFGLAVLSVHTDAGVSAKSTVGRDALHAAVAECKRKKAALIVYKYDRLARNAMDAMSLRAALTASGCRIISATEGETDTSPMASAMFGLASIFAQLDNENRGQRAREGMRARLRDGYWVSGAPVGFRRAHDGRKLILEHDPETSPIISGMFERLASGTMSGAAAVAYLREKLGIRKQTASYILHNAIYKGVICSAATDWQEVRTRFPGIVSAEVFDTAQARLKNIHQGKVHMKQNPSFPLSGIVYCPVCGAPLTGGASTGRGGRKYGHYFCRHAGHVSARSEAVEKSVYRLLAEMTTAEDFMRVIREDIAGLAATIGQGDAKARKARMDRIAKAEKRLDRARQMTLNGLMTDEEYMAERAERLAEIADIRHEIKVEEDIAASHERCLDGMMMLVQHPGEVLNRLNPIERKDFLRALLGKCTIDSSGNVEPPEVSLYHRFMVAASGGVKNGAPDWRNVEPILAEFGEICQRFHLIA